MTLRHFIFLSFKLTKVTTSGGAEPASKRTFHQKDFQTRRLRDRRQTGSIESRPLIDDFVKQL